MTYYMSSTGAWQEMSSAPHDGTVVEVMCTYGVAPWFALARWSRQRMWVWGHDDGPAWQIVAPIQKGSLGGGYVNEGSLKWRPYNGPPPVKEKRVAQQVNAMTGEKSETVFEIETVPGYVDPTGGAQETVNYWRKAARMRPVPGEPLLSDPNWEPKWEPKIPGMIRGDMLMPVMTVLAVATLIVVVLVLGGLLAGMK